MADPWGGYDRNPYYNPEACGLRILGQLEDPKAFYDFSTIVVWEHEGALYGAHDSGCSCPSPFEDVRRLGDLAPIWSISDLDGLISTAEYTVYDTGEVLDLKRKVREFLSR